MERRGMQLFDVVHVTSACLVFGVPIAMVANDLGEAGNLAMVAVCAGIGTLGAIISTTACHFWPGMNASGWKLWSAAWLLNPVVFLCAGWAIYDHRCFFVTNKGWGCLVAYAAALLVAVSVVPPTLAVGARALQVRAQ